MHATDLLSIGQLAARTGLSVSAIRFYEAKGLVSPARNTGGQRRFPRSDIRRLSFVVIAQMLGLSIGDIEAELRRLPDGRTPNRQDWAGISRSVRSLIDERIAALARMRDKLDGCIGCGCLSLKNCALYNPQDRAAKSGAGPRFVLAEAPKTAGRAVKA